MADDFRPDKKEVLAQIFVAELCKKNVFQMMREFYADPVNVAKFEAWKRMNEKPVNNS